MEGLDGGPLMLPAREGTRKAAKSTKQGIEQADGNRSKKTTLAKEKGPGACIEKARQEPLASLKRWEREEVVLRSGGCTRNGGTSQQGDLGVKFASDRTTGERREEQRAARRPVEDQGGERKLEFRIEKREMGFD